MGVIWMVVAIVVALVLGGVAGFLIGSDRMLRKRKASTSDDGRFFFVECPVCRNKVKCDTANLRKRLESEKPWVDCNRCDASLIAPYMNHEVVRAARAAYQHLVISNKSMREILQEPHHPVRQEEEEAVKESLFPPSPAAAKGAIVVYTNVQPKEQPR